MAKVLRFYRGGVTVADWDALPHLRRVHLIAIMEANVGR